jgi:hypothetical protein
MADIGIKKSPTGPVPYLGKAEGVTLFCRAYRRIRMAEILQIAPGAEVPSLRFL